MPYACPDCKNNNKLRVELKTSARVEVVGDEIFANAEDTTCEQDIESWTPMWCTFCGYGSDDSKQAEDFYKDDE